MAVSSPTNNFPIPCACASAFGRIFYASGSTVYFSQVLQSDNDVGRCYQNNDPTSSEIPDLLDTDGGVVFLEDSRNIKCMTPFRSGVLVFAGNGVWYISNPDGGFKATAYNLQKVTEFGITSVRSVVVAGDTVYYFSPNGVMQIVANEFDVLKAEDITEQSIRSYYLRIFSGRQVSGVYDSKNQQCIWWPRVEGQSAIIYDMRLDAWYPQASSGTGTRIERPFKIENAIYFPSEKTTGGVTSYNFAAMNDTTFKDFDVDQTAYIISGPEHLGKFAHKKSITQATFLMKKTETQVLDIVDGEYVFDSPSGCLFQARWNYPGSNAGNDLYGNTGASGTGREIQLYNPYNRFFVPDTYPADFDTGEMLLKRKLNIRGSGDMVQFVFKAEPEKDLQLLGYSVVYKMKGRM